MKNHFKSNVLIYIATLGGLLFIPILSDEIPNNFNVICLNIGIGWISGFLIMWLINNYFCFKQSCNISCDEFIKCDEFTGYYRFKKKIGKSDFKIDGIPCKLINKNVVFYSDTNFSIFNENLDYFENVKRKNT